MFGKLKEKLKGWIKKSKDEIEEKAEKIGETVEEIPEKPGEEKPEKKSKEEIKKEKAEAKAKKKEEKKKLEEEKAELKSKKKEKQELKETEKIKEKPEETKAIIEEPELSKKEAGTAIKIETEIEEGVPPDIIEEEAKKLDKIIEEAKTEEIPEAPEKFDVAKQKYEPDLEEIKEIQKKSLFSKIKSGFKYKITHEEFNEIFDELEMLLLENNVALEVVEDIKSKLSDKLVGKEIKKENLEKEISEELKNSLNEILIEPDDPLDAVKLKQDSDEPFVILFFGINGTGKTTSIAKIAHLLKQNNMTVALAAADTFRAASIEQIQIHADKLKIPLIKHDYGSDPSAVGFDAIKYAKHHKIKVVLIDTAGRMHTKTNLLQEMKKICRVTNPDLKIFVAESIAGNDATEQAKTFNEMIEIDGSILSKADIDEKGGTVISVSHATNKPIFYLGTGQNYEDLKLFNKEEFIESLGL